MDSYLDGERRWELEAAEQDENFHNQEPCASCGSIHSDEETEETPEDFFRRKVEELKAELPGVTYGYIGNFERWGDDRSLYIFLPHPDRVGSYDDSVSLGLGRSKEQQLK